MITGLGYAQLFNCFIPYYHQVQAMPAKHLM